MTIFEIPQLLETFFFLVNLPNKYKLQQQVTEAEVLPSKVLTRHRPLNP